MFQLLVHIGKLMLTLEHAHSEIRGLKETVIQKKLVIDRLQQELMEKTRVRKQLVCMQTDTMKPTEMMHLENISLNVQ